MKPLFTAADVLLPSYTIVSRCADAGTRQLLSVELVPELGIVPLTRFSARRRAIWRVLAFLFEARSMKAGVAQFTEQLLISESLRTGSISSACGVSSSLLDQLEAGVFTHGG